MSKQVKEVNLDIVHYLSGFSDKEPEGVRSFVELRSSLADLKTSIDPKLLEGVTKSKAKKADWVNAFMSLSPLDKRKLVMRSPSLIPLLPRDLKQLKVKSCKSCGTRSFNPGRRIEFNVYGVFDVMSSLSPKVA